MAEVFVRLTDVRFSGAVVEICATGIFATTTEHATHESSHVRTGVKLKALLIHILSCLSKTIVVDATSSRSLEPTTVTSL